MVTSIILENSFKKLIVLIVLLKLWSLSPTVATQMDSKSVLLVQEKQKKLQSVMSELSSIAEETKAAEEGAIAKRNLAEKSQTEYEKLTAEELMQIAYSRDSALRADAALNKVLADEEAINDIDKKVFELKLKNTQLKKKLLRTENELANAQIQYITTRNQTLYPYNAEKDVKLKANANINNMHNGLDFLNHLNLDAKRVFDLGDQVSFVNASNIISGPKALRRGFVSEGMFDSLKEDKQPDRSKLNLTEMLNNTLQQLETTDVLSENRNSSKSTLDNFFPYNLNLFPSYMNTSAASRESGELNSPSNLKDDLAVRPWDTARFNGDSLLDMSIPSNNEASFADTFLNSYDNNTMDKGKSLSGGGDVVAAYLNNSKIF
ncbi:uncharacterized protein LOC111044381 isoform X1 [Nilaparvata lugens]|uniref:uncharacterized protein LOC111044381 isoform X1 n=1 Tax=Nilaparvata lugens TaxID=108931 RepID=UPI000B97F0C2|nr:uncharacterized protein LOC111044381 isoform X1 [Nilaparvata lugens]